MSDKNKLSERCKAQMDILANIEADNNGLKSANVSLEARLSDMKQMCHHLETEVSRFRAELEEFHRREMQRLIGD